MNRLWVYPVLIILVVLTGCAGLTIGGEETPTSISTESVTRSPMPDSTVTDAQTKQETSPVGVTETTTPSPAAQNPWSERSITVSLKYGTGYIKNRSHQRVALQRALQWYNQAQPSPYPLQLQYAEYSIDEKADIIIEATASLESCGGEISETSFAWCAPTYEPGDSADSTEEVEIATQYEENFTEQIYRGVLAQTTGVPEPTRLTGVASPEELPVWSPWPASKTVTIGLQSPEHYKQAVKNVRTAVDYWENGTGSQYKNYSVDFIIEPNATVPDVVINYTDRVGLCGFTSVSDLGGCAPIYTGDAVADEISEIRISKKYTSESQLQILKHEFGHLHGRLHGQEPLPLMSNNSQLTRESTTNATEKVQPWKFDRIRVYLARGSIIERDRNIADREFEAAFKSLSSIEDVPNNVTFRRVDERDRADIVVNATSLSGDSASTAAIYGQDVDEDDALESYTVLNVSIDTGTPAEDYAYHIAYWVVGSFIGEGETRPEHLDADSTDNREDWERNH